MKKQEYKPVNIKNKKATFNFEIEDMYTCGMMLQGTEIKSIRLQKVSMGEAYCYLDGSEVFVKNMHISPYDFGTHYNHNPLRERKLLLEKKEINKIKKALEVQGMSLIPMRLFVSDRGFAKLVIGVGKGKKTHDKRESLKEKDAKKRIKENL